MDHTWTAHTDSSHQHLARTSRTDGSHGQWLAPPPPPPRPQMARAGAAPSPAEHQPRVCASTRAPDGRGLCTSSAPAPGRAGQAAAMCRPHHQGSPGASSQALVAMWPRRPAVNPPVTKQHACLAQRLPRSWSGVQLMAHLGTGHGTAQPGAHSSQEPREQDGCPGEQGGHPGEHP